MRTARRKIHQSDALEHEVLDEPRDVGQRIVPADQPRLLRERRFEFVKESEQFTLGLQNGVS